MTTSTPPRTRTMEYRDPWQLPGSPALPPDARGSLLKDWLQHELAHLVADDDGMGGARSPQIEEVVEALRALEEQPTEAGGSR